jgi:UDP-N-acetylglucosamine 1-carboxyvinyltransferase
LGDLGVKIDRISRDTCIFQADNINIDYLTSDDFKRKGSGLRGSIMIMGPLLARFGKAFMPRPGGDKIGRRRIDTHIIGFENLGAKFTYDAGESFYRVVADKLQGAYMLLDEASVTGTANIVMAASLAQGTTTIYNAACEPYLQQLSKMINRMGGKISGIGSNLLTIEGVDYLGGCEHRCLPDMIEIGSFIGMAAMTRSELTIKNTAFDELGVIPSVFQRLGINLERRGDDIYIPSQDIYEIDTFIDGSILTVSDAPWPGFTPDLLSIVLVTATQARGSVLIHQKMFESRLFFVDKLIDMGAQIILCDPHRATVIGLERKTPLRGVTMTSPDIRAGVSLLIAALSADGESTIHNISQIDRGYQNIEQRLRAIGAQIERI